MKVVILAGGYGTRLSEETAITPKPMIEIGGRPLLWHLMKSFSSHGINEFIIALGYKGEVIKRYFLHYSELQSNLKIDLGKNSFKTENCIAEDWQIELIETGTDTMTGGRLKRLAEKIDDTFIFTYGDGLSNIDINKLVAFHKSHGKLATVTAVTPVSRFGLLNIDDSHQVKSFSEKPDFRNDLINGGFFVLEPDVLDYIDDDTTSWEREPCEQLVKDGQMMAYRHTDFWQCVDTLHELRLLRHLWDNGQASWKTW
ncbi:MAG: glucose-1-phosphate cytidylyltransferase [Gammaproteobacteria bacterium]|nr:glucose-1-phosphate cytidylyltransferase [Gammaproteobacteria bacterium]